MAKKKKPDPVDVLVGNRLRMRRLTLGRSQTEVATAVGVTFHAVQLIGVRCPAAAFSSPSDERYRKAMRS